MLTRFVLQQPYKKQYHCPHLTRGKRAEWLRNACQLVWLQTLCLFPLCNAAALLGVPWDTLWPMSLQWGLRGFLVGVSCSGCCQLTPWPLPRGFHLPPLSAMSLTVSLARPRAALVPSVRYATMASSEQIEMYRHHHGVRKQERKWQTRGQKNSNIK